MHQYAGKLTFSVGRCYLSITPWNLNVTHALEQAYVDKQTPRTQTLLVSDIRMAYEKHPDEG